MKSKPVKISEATPNGTSEPAIDEVLQIIQFMGESGLAEIDLDTPHLKLSLRKFAAPAAQPMVLDHQVPVLPHPVPQGVPPVPVAKKPEKIEAVVPSKVYHKILSPMAGTFYRAPSTTAAPYVKEGDPVTVGMPVCIVEAMKLMNEIKVDKTGKVVKIHIGNGKPVEKGTLLFEIDTEVTG